MTSLEALSHERCLELLRSQYLGRIGFVIDGQPQILPVNYAMLGSDVVFWTGAGSKLSAVDQNQAVAFEIDGATTISHDGWSVLVVGAAHEIVDNKTREVVKALSLRPWVAGARDHVVRITGQRISGRRISHNCSLTRRAS